MTYGPDKNQGFSKLEEKMKTNLFFLQMATLGAFMDVKSEHIGHAAKTLMWTYRFGNNQEN